MYLPDIALHEATTLEEAATLLRRHGPDTRLLAGGTDLLVDLKTGRIKAEHVVSINRISSLRGVTDTGNGIRIGALTTITELSRSPIVRERFPAILDATRNMAAQQIRNMATVGGNIASAVPCADLPPILMVMDALVELWSADEEREDPLASFFVGPRDTIRRDDEILTAVLVPHHPSGYGAAYARFALREGNAIAVASVAAGVQLDGEGRIGHARIALGAVAPMPKPAPSAGRLLIGQRPSDDAFAAAADAAMTEAEPISDIRGSAEFRCELIGVLARRALATACQRAGEAAR